VDDVCEAEWQEAAMFICCLQGETDPPESSRQLHRSRNEEHPHIGKYRLLKTIGKGNFAKVKLARHVPTGKEVSVVPAMCLTEVQVSQRAGLDWGWFCPRASVIQIKNIKISLPHKML